MPSPPQMGSSRLASVLAACLLLAMPATAFAQQAPRRIEAAAPASVRSLPDEFQQERYTKRGILIGAAIGGAGGVAFGTLIALFCESEGEGCWAAIPLVGLAGAVGGGLVGGIIGATVPRDDGPPPARPDTARAPTPYEEVFRAPRRTGSFGVAVGFSDADIANALEGSGPAARLHLAAEVRPWIAIGLEGGQSFLGDAGDVRHVAVSLRGTWPGRRVSPYLNGNLGYYDMTEPSLEFFGGSLGIGARVLPREDSRWFLDVEGRLSRNLQNIEPLRMRSLLAGIGWYW